MELIVFQILDIGCIPNSTSFCQLRWHCGLLGVLHQPAHDFRRDSMTMVEYDANSNDETGARGQLLRMDDPNGDGGGGEVIPTEWNSNYFLAEGMHKFQ